MIHPPGRVTIISGGRTSVCGGEENQGRGADRATHEDGVDKGWRPIVGVTYVRAHRAETGYVPCSSLERRAYGRRVTLKGAESGCYCLILVCCETLL